MATVDNQETGFVGRYVNLLREMETLKEDTKTLKEQIKEAGLNPSKIKIAAEWKISDEIKREKALEKEREIQEARELADHS